jgi:hypothetical protein
MLILAIDTALDACAAGVLDTEAGQLIAQESQAMKRGHAEALMPLIARVIKESGIAFASLDRIAVTTGPGSFTGLRVGLCCTRGQPERRTAGDIRHRCAARPCVFSGGQRQWQFVDPAARRAD